MQRVFATLNKQKLGLASQVVVDVGKGGVQAETDSANSENDHNCDQSGDQTVFDCGRAFFVFHETNDVFHMKNSQIKINKK